MPHDIQNVGHADHSAGFLLAIVAVWLAGAIGSLQAAEMTAAEAIRSGDYATARTLLQPQADAGDPQAQLNLGLLYATGRGGAKDLREAAAWYRRAAEQGLPAAQNNLANAYLQGLGVDVAPDEAARWLQRAAEQGDPRAQYNLGTLYARGSGVPNDMTEAVYWWRQAAQQGVVAAQYNMGIASADGTGLTQNDAAAVYWLANAAANGDARARRELPQYAQQLPTVAVTASGVRVRAGSGTDTRVIGHVSRNDQVPVLGRSRDNWTMVYLRDSRQLGWVASSLLASDGCGQ